MRKPGHNYSFEPEELPDTIATVRCVHRFTQGLGKVVGFGVSAD
jgi:hypothetical protein